MGLSREVRPGIEAAFRDFAASCADLAAPTTADLALCAAQWSDEEPLRSLLAPYADARPGDVLPLRLMAAAHRLVLQRESPELALYVATVGGTPPRTDADRERCSRAFLAALDEHRESVAEGLSRVPQTNEVGRTVGLAALLRRVHREFGLPVRLHEIGCSAGLSLRVDALVDAGVVPADHVAWGALPVIVERVGCDLSPVDVDSTEGRLHLSSYVWFDHVARFERLGRALAVADAVDAELITRDAVEHVRSLRLVEGTTLVLWHSAMWLYLPDESREQIDAALEELGSRAGAGSPLVHVALEPCSDRADQLNRFTLSMTTWPGIDGVPAGTRVPWARTPPSGEPVTWSVPCAGAVVTDADDRVLLVLRRHAPARGQWSLPGGRVEEGEPWDSAARREVLEETGIDARVVGFAGIVERAGDAGSGTTYLIADYLMSGSGRARAGDDAADARWFSAEDILGLDVAPGVVDALREWGVLPG